MMLINKENEGSDDDLFEESYFANNLSNARLREKMNKEAEERNKDARKKNNRD